MDKKDSFPTGTKGKPMDLNDVEMIGSPNSPKPVGRPDVHISNERKRSKDSSSSHTDKQQPDSDVETVPTQPLLEPDRGRQKPPLAGPEVDDLDGDERPTDAAPYPGIDDGLLEPGDKPPGHDEHEEHEGSDVEKEHRNGGGVITEDGKWWHDHDEPDFPYDGINGFGPRSAFDPDRTGSPFIPGSIPDVNTYQQKKNLAQGMMDLALLSANANQLRYVLESSSTHPYFYPSITFISLSILLQIAVGVGLIMNSRYNVKDDKDICKADKINNMTVLGVFLVTIVNVFITSFSVATPDTASKAVQTVGTG